MGNSGSYGLQIEVQKLAMTESDHPRAIANKQDKVVDTYSFGISSSGKLPLISVSEHVRRWSSQSLRSAQSYENQPHEGGVREGQRADRGAGAELAVVFREDGGAEEVREDLHGRADGRAGRRG